MEFRLNSFLKYYLANCFRHKPQIAFLLDVRLKDMNNDEETDARKFPQMCAFISDTCLLSHFDLDRLLMKRNLMYALPHRRIVMVYPFHGYAISSCTAFQSIRIYFDTLKVEMFDVFDSNEIKGLRYRLSFKSIYCQSYRKWIRIHCVRCVVVDRRERDFDVRRKRNWQRAECFVSTPRKKIAFPKFDFFNSLFRICCANYYTRFQ